MPGAPDTHVPDGTFHRLVPAAMTPAAIFESHVPAADIPALLALEALTDDHARTLAGGLRMVAPEDIVTGPGAGVLMAAVTQLGRPSRFSDGSFGVYYAADSLAAAGLEVGYHLARFFRETAQGPLVRPYRAWTCQVSQPLRDVRDREELHAPLDYAPSQVFGRQCREARDHGLHYRSVRAEDATCIAIFRPPAVSLPAGGPELRMVWDGQDIGALPAPRNP